MGFAKKIWQNRLVEYAGRRKLTNVTTGTQQVVDVVREEGSVSQEGSAFDASNMNDLEQRISDGFADVQVTTDGINWHLGGVHIIVEGTGAGIKYYMQHGSDINTKKKLGSAPINLGAGTSIDVTKYYSGYSTLTINNFFVCVTGIGLAAWASSNTTASWQGGSASPQTISKSYNPKTGILTIGGTGISYDYNRGDYNPHVAASATVNIQTFLIP